MLQVNVLKFSGDPHQAVLELLPVYKALRVAAIRENNLRGFWKAEIALHGLESLKQAFEQLQEGIEKGWYKEWTISQPYYYLAEDSDTIDDLMEVRETYTCRRYIAFA